MIEFNRIKALAKKRKITLRELNDQAGFGTNSIYNWKNRQPSSSALRIVAQLLHTTTDYLTGLTNDPASTSGKKDTIPIDEEKPYSYHGYYVPHKYLRMIQDLMEDDIKEGKATKHGQQQK